MKESTESEYTVKAIEAVRKDQPSAKKILGAIRV
jgi:hypothetical protein